VSGSRSRVQESPGDSPTTIDISRLHRQPGSLLELSFELPAPGDLHVSMARVPEGSPVEMDVSVESVVEGIWVSGAADVDVVAECSRCLDSVEWSQMVSIEQMFRYPATDARGALVEEPQDDDEETPEVVADTIDMHGPLRDAIVLSPPAGNGSRLMEIPTTIPSLTPGGRRWNSCWPKARRRRPRSDRAQSALTYWCRRH
jgi:uncharacterized metal-binding protein YceD (DUF177 family)